VADQHAEVCAQAIGYALNQAGVAADTDLVLVQRDGGPVDPALVDRLGRHRRVRVVADEAAELGPAGEGSAVPDGAVLVALRPGTETGPPYRVRLAVYRSMDDAIGGTYLIDRTGSGWAVTGVEDFFDLRAR
jgi:hypothetical protein